MRSLCMTFRWPWNDLENFILKVYNNSKHFIITWERSHQDGKNEPKIKSLRQILSEWQLFEIWGQMRSRSSDIPIEIYGEIFWAHFPRLQFYNHGLFQLGDQFFWRCIICKIRSLFTCISVMDNLSSRAILI